jgi:hypothetical protein
MREAALNVPLGVPLKGRQLEGSQLRSLFLHVVRGCRPFVPALGRAISGSARSAVVEHDRVDDVGTYVVAGALGESGVG